METRISNAKAKKSVKSNQHKKASKLDIQLLEKIEKIIEKASSTSGLSEKSATEILLEDRR